MGLKNHTVCVHVWYVCVVVCMHVYMCALCVYVLWGLCVCVYIWCGMYVCYKVCGSGVCVYTCDMVQIFLRFLGCTRKQYL